MTGRMEMAAMEVEVVATKRKADEMGNDESKDQYSPRKRHMASFIQPKQVKRSWHWHFSRRLRQKKRLNLIRRQSGARTNSLFIAIQFETDVEDRMEEPERIKAPPQPADYYDDSFRRYVEWVRESNAVHSVEPFAPDMETEGWMEERRFIDESFGIFGTRTVSQFEDVEMSEEPQPETFDDFVLTIRSNVEW